MTASSCADPDTDMCLEMESDYAKLPPLERITDANGDAAEASLDDEKDGVSEPSCNVVSMWIKVVLSPLVAEKLPMLAVKPDAFFNTLRILLKHTCAGRVFLGRLVVVDVLDVIQVSTHAPGPTANETPTVILAGCDTSACGQCRPLESAVLHVEVLLHMERIEYGAVASVTLQSCSARGGCLGVAKMTWPAMVDSSGGGSQQSNSAEPASIEMDVAVTPDSLKSAGYVYNETRQCYTQKLGFAQCELRPGAKLYVVLDDLRLRRQKEHGWFARLYALASPVPADLVAPESVKLLT